MAIDFTTWTREDFTNFDTQRQLVMQPTPEEIAIQQALIEANNLAIITSKLSALWITKPDIITKEFVLWFLEAINAKQFVWEDLSGWVDNQIILFWDLETAFNELVIRYL